MDVEYLDFELEIGAGDTVVYPLSVVHSPAGTMRGELNFDFGQIELQNRLLALQNALLRSGGSRRKALTREEKTVQTFGVEMFDALFHDDLRALYYESKRTALSQGKGLRLKLRVVAPELAALPWEYLYDARDGEYVCLSSGTPVVRYLEVAQPPRPLKVTPPLRILGMVASPRGLPQLDVEIEKERLERAVAGLQENGLVELEWLEGETWRDLTKAMRPTRGPWHVFHFIGHGGFDSARDEGVLAVCNRQGERYDLTATQLARVLADHRTLRLVVLNACEGAQGSGYDIFSSAAATLVRRGVPSVIAMQYEITDQAAIEFSEQLYDALAEGLPVDTAVTEARKSVSLAINNTLEWGIPVLFMQAPDGVLFEVAEGVDRAKKKPIVEAEGRLEDDKTPTVVVEPVRPKASERLSGDQLKELLGAMLDAYTTESSLRQMVRFELDENLDGIAGGSDLSEKMFNLIDWAERTGRLTELVEKAHRFNPGNARLRTFAGSMPGLTVVAEERKAPAQPRAAKFEKKEPSPASPIEFDWVTIPAGEFTMGSDKRKDPMAIEDRETPQHTVDLSKYRIARVPVTVSQFARFVKATNYRTSAEKGGSGWVWTGSKWEQVEGADWAHPTGPKSDVRDKQDHPVTQVSWHDAQAFCGWAKVRLPTEAEWEKAARGTDGHIWPWGNQKPTDKLCNFNNNVGDTTPVGNYPEGASPYGLLDVAGNVWEWTSSVFLSYPYDAGDGREDPQADGRRTLRGGSWLNYHDGVRCAYRSDLSP